MGDFSWDKMSPEQIQTAKSIKSAAIEQGLDPKYALSIGFMESSFNPKAKATGSSAQGPMQLIEGTAKDLGVDPSNPEDNIKGGVKYLKQHMDKYKDPYVAAIAYKAGPAVADEFLKTKDLSKLDKETISYLKNLRGHLGEAQPKEEEVKTQPAVKPPVVTKPSDASKFKLSSAAEEAAQGVKDIFTKPTEEQDFSLGRIATSTGLGAATGLLGGPFAEVTVPGGAVAGFASGVAGELGRMSGAPEGVTFALEMGAGALPELGAKLAKSAAGKVILPYSGKTLANMIPESKGEMKAALLAKEKMFGSPTFSGMSSTEASDATQATLKQNLGNAGYVFGQGEKASDAVRSNLYADMSDLLKKKVDVTVTTPPRQELGVAGVRTVPGKTVTKKVPNAFINSPAYKELNKSLDVLSERNLVSPTERNNLNKILDNQTSSNPKVAEKASQDIINLIQNGGSYTVEGETKKMISPDAQKALRDSFNNYLEKNTGRRTYDILKGAEEQEFIAAARDSIPTILKSGFRGGKKEYIAALENIKKSPEGRSELAKAVTQHISQLNEAIDPATGKVIQKEINPDKMINELARLKPAITRSGVMSDAQFATLENQIKSLPQAITKEKRAQFIKLITQKALAGAVSAEGARAVSNVNPLGAFSL